MTLHSGRTDLRSAVGTDPAQQAFLLLRTVFTIAPVVFGLDKFANVLTDWPQYLAPWIDDIVPGTAQQAMYAVGVVEVLAGVLVAVLPRIGGWVVAAWLAGIIVNLLTIPGFYDIALRDFGLLVAADRPAHLRVLRGRDAVDVPAAEQAVVALLRALGRDPVDAHLADTPRRVADAFAELLTPPPFDLTTFPNDEGYNELVMATSIPVQSLCEHHLLPFTGVAHIGYLPGNRILGLSKLARVLDLFARDLQVQERLTQQVADWLQDNLDPRGVGVVIEAEHLCMSLRGVRARGARTTTSALHGLLREDARSRQEFFALAGLRG